MATRLITKTWKVEDVLTNVTSAKCRVVNGSGVEVVAQTDMNSDSTGVYYLSFSDSVGTSYTVTIVIVYLGATYTFTENLDARSATGDMVASYYSLLERVGHCLFGIRTGYSADQTTDIEECIRDGLRDVYAAHQWSFFRPEKEITTVAGTVAYDLPVSCEAIIGDMTYEPGESDFYPPIKQRHIEQVRRWLQDDDEQGRPRFFGVETVDFDATEGSLRKAVLYPTPDSAYTVNARMQLRPTMITEVKQYPVGGETLSQLITEACLAAAERNYDEQEKVHTKRFQELLPLAVLADQEMTSPTSLGPDSPKTDSADYPSRAARMGDVTLNGVTL